MLQMLPFNTFIFSFQTCSLNSKYASRMVAGMTINYSRKKHNMFIRTKKLFLYRCKVRGRSFACCFGAKADKWITCERRGKGFDYIISLLDGLKTPILLRRSGKWSKATLHLHPHSKYIGWIYGGILFFLKEQMSIFFVDGSLHKLSRYQSISECNKALISWANEVIRCDQDR